MHFIWIYGGFSISKSILIYGFPKCKFNYSVKFIYKPLSTPKSTFVMLLQPFVNMYRVEKQTKTTTKD